MFWKAVSPFMSEVTKSKVVMVNTKKRRETLAGIFDLVEVEPDLGGDSSWQYDHAWWMATQRARYQTMLATAARRRSLVLSAPAEVAAAVQDAAAAAPAEEELKDDEAAAVQA